MITYSTSDGMLTVTAETFHDEWRPYCVVSLQPNIQGLKNGPRESAETLPEEPSAMCKEPFQAPSVTTTYSGYELNGGGMKDGKVKTSFARPIMVSGSFQVGSSITVQELGSNNSETIQAPQDSSVLTSKSFKRPSITIPPGTGLVVISFPEVNGKLFPLRTRAATVTEAFDKAWKQFVPIFWETVRHKLPQTLTVEPLLNIEGHLIRARSDILAALKAPGYGG